MSATGNDETSTYLVNGRKKAELHRLVVQDQLITSAMGGVLPEQAEPTLFESILDIGCGTGGWLLEIGKISPKAHLVGVDINPLMLRYALEQAKERGLAERVAFREMDVLRGLDFPENSFNLVNLRLGSSYVRTWDWPKLIFEMQRVARPGGVIRITESEPGVQSTSSAMTQLNVRLVQALYKAGNFFTEESTGLTAFLQELLTKSWCEDVQTKNFFLEFRAGTPEGLFFVEDMKIGFQAAQPFILKWTGISRTEYLTLYQQACKEMEQHDFRAIWPHLTAWGKKPFVRGHS